MQEQGDEMDEKTITYFNTLQANLTTQINGLREVFQAKLDQIIDISKENSGCIKEHTKDISTVKIDLTELRGNVKILEDNKDVKAKQRRHTIAIASLAVSTVSGFVYFMINSLGG